MHTHGFPADKPWVDHIRPAVNVGVTHCAVPLSSLWLYMQDMPQDVATCQGTLAVALAALLSADTPPHLAKLVQRWLQQAVSAFPWLRWHTPLSRQLSEVWDTGTEGPQGAKPHSTPAAAVLRQVVSRCHSLNRGGAFINIWHTLACE